MAYSFIPQEVSVWMNSAAGYPFINSSGASRTLYPTFSEETLQNFIEVMGEDFYIENVNLKGFTLRERYYPNSTQATVKDDYDLLVPMLRNTRLPNLAFTFGSSDLVVEPKNLYFVSFNLSEKQMIYGVPHTSANRTIHYFDVYAINKNFMVLYAREDEYVGGPIIFTPKGIVVDTITSGNPANNQNLVFIHGDGTTETDTYYFVNSSRWTIQPFYVEDVIELDAFPNMYVQIRGNIVSVTTRTKDGKTYLICGPKGSRYLSNPNFTVVFSQDALGV